MSLSSSSPTRPEIHGHRGCRGLLPENTLPAFLHALTLGVDVLEMDVVISADQQVVVSHEPWLNPAICLDPDGNRIATATTPVFNLYELPYGIIRRCDCGQLRHPNFPQQASQPTYKPLLREVFALIENAALTLGRSPIRYAIEIKSDRGGDTLYHPAPDEYLLLVLDEINAAQVAARTTLLCFDPRILRLAHQRQPSLATCLLAEAGQSWAATLQGLGFMPTTFGPDYHTVSSESVRRLRTDFPGLRLVPWTVNELSDMRRLQAMGVDGITTDFPDRLLALLLSGK